jgi:predicted negative regulator of RcsB-dependent stress response
MSDETQKRMEFIVEQLADLTAKQQQTDANLNRLANASLSRIERIEGVLGALAEAQVRTEEHVAALAQAQLRAEERAAEADERLNSLINVVERHISEGRNGGARE